MTLVTCPRCGRQVAGGKFCPGCGSKLDDPLSGKLLGGKWKLVAQTSRGPFFATYHAEPKSGGAAVAVKVLDASMSEDDARRRRFLENAGGALALTDRRLLAVREMAEEPVDGADGKPRRAVFAVADAPVGPSLADVVRKQGAMDPARAAARVRGMLDALAAVHASGVVHGDLHPACVFLEPDGKGGESVRIADAGLGRGLGPSMLAEGTDPAVLGSDGGRWISPEQATGQQGSAASDLHAAGAVLYYALTGGPPWQAEKGQALLFEIQRSFPRPVSEVRPRAPQGLDAVLDRALAKGPQERYGSAGEFAKALASAVSGIAAAPGPELPDDVTPGAVSLDATATGAADPGDATIAAPRPSSPPAAGADSDVHTAAPVETGDETIIGTRAPGRSPPAAPPRRPGGPAPTAVARPSSPGRQVGGQAPKGAAPPAKGRSSSSKGAAPPAAEAEEAPAAPAPQAKPGKVRGPWTVGTPVTVFSILGFLGVGALYGFVWAGRLDWDVPPWLRALTGRDEIPHIGESVRIADQTTFRSVLNVEVPLGIRRPMSGEGKEALYGSWRLVRDPVDETSSPPAPGTAAPAEKVFAMGDFRGEPTESGVLPLDLLLPPGKYRLHGTFRFGEVERNQFEIKDSVKTVPFLVKPHQTRLVVRTRPEVAKKVTLERFPNRLSEKTTERGIAEVVFGLPPDGDAGRLFFGEECTIRVEAGGYGKFEERITLDSDPHLKEIELVEDRRDKVQQAKRELEKNERLPPAYENDPAVLGAPEILALLAKISAKNGAFAKVESYLENLQAVLAGKPFPPEAAPAYRQYHDYLHGLAVEAAKRGDIANVREARAKTRPEVFATEEESKAERARWAVVEVAAFRNFPPSATGKPEGRTPDLEPVARMVEEDLKLLPEADRARMRREVAKHILDHRAWAAWRAGNDLRPARENETPPVPGPEIRTWLDLAKKAWPEGDTDPEFNVSYQRLAARLEDLENHPENVVFLLLNDGAWKSDKAVPNQRLDLLTKKDMLLLARAFARWGDLRFQAKEEAEAKRLWKCAWDIYALRLGAADPAGDFPEELAAASLFEAARIGGYIRPNNEDALAMIDAYLKIRPGDEEARKLKRALVGEKGLVVPQWMQNLKYDLVLVPEGVFEVGTDEIVRAEERPFRTGGMDSVQVNVLSRRDLRIAPFLGGIREVTYGQYKSFMQLDGEAMQKLRHPDEPPERKAAGAREPVAEKRLADAEPVRGVDWWDAWACARYLGGRLPTEAEWEKLARWSGRPKPSPDPLPEIRKKFETQWAGLWPDEALTLGVFDVAPSGARGMLGGVAEWTMDTFDNPERNAKGAQTDARAVVPPKLGSGATLMAVRGGSFWHRAPGDGQGKSLYEESLAAAVAPGTQIRETEWRAMDLLERRGIRAEVTAPWLGFRVVVGSPEGEERRPTK